MRDFELELIASLAEGSLQDETEARALIESSAELRAEYEAQLLALERLHAVHSTGMSEHEKTSLHRDIWAALRSEPAARHTPSHWYYRWVPAAAALLVVVGVLSVLPGGSDSADEGAATTVQASGRDTDQEQSELTGEDGGGEAAIPPAAPGENSAALAFGTEVQRLRDSTSNDFMADMSEDAPGEEKLASCVTTALSDEFTVLGTIPDPTAPEGATGYSRPATLIVAVPTESDLAKGPVALINERTCELVHLEE